MPETAVQERALASLYGLAIGDALDAHAADVGAGVDHDDTEQALHFGVVVRLGRQGCLLVTGGPRSPCRPCSMTSWTRPAQVTLTSGTFAAYAALGDDSQGPSHAPTLDEVGHLTDGG